MYSDLIDVFEVPNLLLVICRSNDFVQYVFGESLDKFWTLHVESGCEFLLLWSDSSGAVLVS